MIKRLQALLRWAFMRVEALFNTAFGDRLNPLYHLGSITFALFWLITVSGLYLYVFFETGVTGAYDSVESLTHKDFVGGIMRSLHRYASDALVLTMLLHMVRNYAFDRLRGFRWFSWASGVALIWGVYISGVIGYMLPWDQLAQYVIVASFEWLDWLPGFGGSLMRNFIYPHSVNDRFFSLLSFMHIGLPLGVLLLMWIHVQRVPKAKTMPPRPLAWSVLVTLLVLSLVKPVLSQGGAANLAVVPGELRLDWYYLAVFPLIDLWPLARVWLLLGGATLLAFELPWVPPRLRRGKPSQFQLGFPDLAKTVTARSGETLLDAGLREGLSLPYECRNGGCGVCRCKVLYGSVDHGVYQRSALPDEARAIGEALMCCATALSDVEIEVLGATGVARAPLKTFVGRIDVLERLATDVIRLVIALPDGEHIRFAAGQYINILLDDGQRRAYSFANAPRDTARIELHVRHVPGGLFTDRLFGDMKVGDMKVGDTVRFEGPLGGFKLRDSELPILFVAGATGFAPVKSIVEDAFHRGLQRPMWLYWGVRRPQDLYMGELADQWQREHANFHFVPVLSHAEPQDAWTGRVGLVHEAMLTDFPDMKGFEVYVCGSVKMVEAAVPAFIGHGMNEDLCFFDKFTTAATATTSPTSTTQEPPEAR